MNATQVNKEKEDWLFRIVTPLFPPQNIYRRPAKKTTSLGPIMVATEAKEGRFFHQKDSTRFSVEVIDENNYWQNRGAPYDQNGFPDHLTLQQDRQADIVGFYCGITNSTPRCLELIGFYKNMPEHLRPKAIIVGGWHAMDYPEEFLEAGADVVVHGEAEVIIKLLLITLKEGKSLAHIPGISYWLDGEIKRNGPRELKVPQEEMDNLAAPDYSLVRYAKLKIIPIGRVRGCSGKCRFCRVKSPPRYISAEKFLDQLKVLISQGYRDFFVVDDRSEEDSDGYLFWLRGLAEFRIGRRIKISLTTQNRLSLASDQEVLRAMRDAGVDLVAIGFESPIAEELKAMRKPLSPDEMVEWTKIWKNFGFYIHAMFIFGYPLSPEAKKRLKVNFEISAKERGDKFWQFIKKINPDTLQVLLFTPLPGTEDWEFLQKSNRILPLGWEYFDGNHLCFEPAEEIDPKELQYEMIKLMRKFYAFHYLWRLGIISLLVHLVKIGLVTISMPFVWLFVGYRPWYKVWRNAKRRFQGHVIILAWLNDFKKLGFIKKLTDLVNQKAV